MATYTSNLGLKMPAQSDKIRIADINGNMDDIDSAIGAVGSKSIATQMGDIRAGLAIVAVNNTHAAIASGEYVYLTGHSTLDDGLYTASSAIAQNATLSSSNLTAVSGGGLNSLSNQIGTLNSNITPVSGSLQATSNCTFYRSYYNKVNKMVSISGYGKFNNNVTGSTALFKIPYISSNAFDVPISMKSGGNGLLLLDTSSDKNASRNEGTMNANDEFWFSFTYRTSEE